MRRISMLAAAAATAGIIATSIPSTGAGNGPPASAHRHGAAGAGGSSRELASAIARARVALAPFATNLRRARTGGGYKLQITRMIPDMGYHYMNPDVKEFDVRRPPILVYVRRGGKAQLVAAEWVFPSKPDKPPLPGARYGSFAAACHYADGTFSPRTTRRRAGRRALTAARRSASGTPTWSRSTCGCGIRTPPACSTARTRSSRRSTRNDV